MGSSDSVGTPYQDRLFMGEAFAGFAWSTATPNLVVAAVSQSVDGTEVNATGGLSQVGIYYSTNAGATWLLATIQDPGGGLVQAPQLPIATAAAGTAVVWDPVRASFFAAVRFHGYYQSADGIHWTRLANQPGLSLSTANCPSTYSSVACPLFRGALALQPTSGDLFAITTDINNLNQGVWQDACSATAGVCASATVNFQSLPSQALENGAGVIPQGDYDLWIAAVPVSNDTILYAGTEDIFRCSLAAGCAWRNTTNTNTCAAAQVAPAQHAVDATFGGSASSTTPGLMYFGNDGGLWRTTDGITQLAAPCSADDAAHFQNLNGGLGSLAEVADFAADPAEPGVFLAAQGAVGTSADTAAASTAWPQVLGGEGNQVAIDPVNSMNWFSASGSGVSIQECALGDACSIAGFGAVAVGSAQVGGDGDALEYPAPWMLDPQDSTQVIVGTCRVWRGPVSGVGWSAGNDLSPFLDGDGPSGSNPVCTSDGDVESIAASGTVSNLPGSQELIYAGMGGVFNGGANVAGHLYGAAVSNASTAMPVWTDLSTSPVTNDIAANNGQFNPGGFGISSIAVDPHDTTGETVYATIEGFSGSGISERRVYRSVDGGAHWLNVSSNLPGAPVNTVVVDPNDANTVYVGMDVGVYVTREIANCAIVGMSCWSLYGTGLPNAPIIQLAVVAGQGAAAGTLQAATYGRGIWQTGLTATATTGTLVPASLTFAAQALSTTSAAQALMLTNTGAQPLDISQTLLTAGYAETDNCAGFVAVGASCTLEVTFTPAVVGAAPGTIVVYANVAGGQLSSTLSGTGVQGAMIVPLPTSLAFGNELVGSTSAAQNVTVSNTGQIASNLTSETVTGIIRSPSIRAGRRWLPARDARCRWCLRRRFREAGRVR